MIYLIYHQCLQHLVVTIHMYEEHRIETTVLEFRTLEWSAPSTYDTRR